MCVYVCCFNMLSSTRAILNFLDLLLQKSYHNQQADYNLYWGESEDFVHWEMANYESDGDKLTITVHYCIPVKRADFIMFCTRTNPTNDLSLGNEFYFELNRRIAISFPLIPVWEGSHIIARCVPLQIILCARIMIWCCSSPLFLVPLPARVWIKDFLATNCVFFF